MLWVAVVLTALSGVIYLWRNRAIYMVKLRFRIYDYRFTSAKLRSVFSDETMIASISPVAFIKPARRVRARVNRES